MKRTIPILLVTISLFFGQRPARGGSGDNDYSFTQRGAIDGPIYAVAVDNQTNIWIGGDFSNVYGKPYQHLAVLHSDGSLNEGLSNGFSTPNGTILALVVDYEGNVYAGGRYGVIRVVPTGGGFELDGNFSINRSQVVSLAIRNPYTLWVSTQNGLYRYDAGVQDTGFQLTGGLNGQFVAQVQYIPGSASQNATIDEHLLLAGPFGVAVATGNGSVDTSSIYGGMAASSAAERNGVARLNCLSSHGDIISAGDFETAFIYNYVFPNENGLNLHRVGGIGDATYFQGISSATNSPNDLGYAISGVAALDGGDMLVIGEFSRIGGVYVNNLAHLLPDGKVDAYFQSGLSYHPNAMAKQPDGKYVIVGYSNYTPLTGFLSRRQAFDAPRPVTFPVPPASQTVYETDDVALYAQVDASPDPELQWLKNGAPMSGQTGSQLYLYGVTTNDTGTYRLEASTFCAGMVDSSSAYLNVLPAPPAPTNDSFTNATALIGVAPAGTGYIRSATTEPGEPNPANNGQGRSVWYNWTASFDGTVVLDASACDFNAAMGVYTGDAVNNLSVIAQNCLQACYGDGEGGVHCFCQGLTNQLSFPVSSNTTYHIAFGGAPNVGSLGNINFRLQPSITVAPTGFSFVGQTIQFNVNGPSGLTVVIEATGTLAPPNWQPIATNILSSTINSILDAYSATNHARYYRARLQ